MASRSDVTKMLRRNPTTAASRASSLVSRGSKKLKIGSSVKVSNGPGSDVGSNVSTNGNNPAKGGPSNQSPVIRRDGKSVGHLLMRCHEILRNSTAPLHTHQLQSALQCGTKIMNDQEFLKCLRDNPRVHFDAVEKTWSYDSPFKHVLCLASLQSSITSQDYGLELNKELLDHHRDIAQWIQELLIDRSVRAIRTGKKTRCKWYPPESDNQCSVYADTAHKCEPCSDLKGLTLYSLLPKHIEKHVVDDDIKEMWHAIQVAPMDEILSEYNLSVQRNRNEGRRRKKPSTGTSRGGRINRIQNAHIYTAETLRQEIQNQAQADG